MKNVPLRCWSMASYDPNTGRCASSLHGPGDVTIEGERIRPNAQMPGGQTAPGTPSLKELDARRTQGGDVRKRPYG